MKKLIIGAVVGLLLASLLLSGGFAAADGNISGIFPNRTINAIRSPPGGPHADTFSINIDPDRNGFWSVTAASIAGSAVVVQVYRNDAGILTLESSSKLRSPNQESERTLLSPGLHYNATFIPYGKAGTSTLHEHFYVPPVAAFTFSPTAPTTDDTVTFDGSSSTDLNNDIVGYSWDFGDGSTAVGVVATHRFALATAFTVTLTVSDVTNLADIESRAITVLPSLNQPPTASFTASRNLMMVHVDATGSSDSDGTIVSYAWDFGDNSVASGVTADHTYAAPNKYAITLKATDDGGAIGTATKLVTVNTSTEDWTFSDFFNVPYGEWWDIRQQVYHSDSPIGADCFSADGITNTWCTPGSALPDVASYPYTNWVKTPIGDAMINAPYRFTADIRQNPALTVERPVVLPRCEDLKAAAAGVGVDYVCLASPPTGGYISINEQIQYLTSARASDLLARGCPDLTFLNDGFISDLQLTLTMDNTAAAKLFDVTDPAQWTFGTSDTSLLKAGCGTGLLLDPNSGILEKGLKAWFEAQGNGPYDILSAFGAPYSVFAIEASGSFDTATNRHTLTADIVASGNEALFARWAYWGATTYLAGLGGAAPAGWWGMEQPWTEGLTFTATFSPASFDAAASGVIQYHLRASGDAGADGIWYTADDTPKWVWQPVLGDRLPSTVLHPASELLAYAGLGYLHTTPGSRRYGTAYLFDYVPATWNLTFGQTQTFLFPTSAAVLYDPYLSPRVDSPASLVPISSGIVPGSSVPATGAGMYDASSHVLSVVGTLDLGAWPTTGTGKPLESRPIYNLVRG